MNENPAYSNGLDAVDTDSMLLQGFDFMSGLPPLDAFDSILW